MATHTNVATAMDFHTKTFNQTSKGATQYSFSGASSVDPVQNVKEKLVVLNTSLVRGKKSTTESIGVDRENVSTHVRSVMDAIELLPLSERTEWYKKLIVIPIYKRDIRGTYGAGERTLCFWVLRDLYDGGFTSTVMELLEEIPNYGSWGDLNKIYRDAYRNRTTFTAYFEDVKKKCISMWVYQLALDEHTYLKVNGGIGDDEKEDSTISLLPKWIPKEKASLARETGIHKDIAQAYFRRGSLFGKLKSYRMLVGKLNTAITTTEKYMASKNWDKIKFRLVPGRCLNKFHRCWLDEDKTGARRHAGDPIRDRCRENYQKFLKDVAEGKASAKGKSMFVHEISRELRSELSGGSSYWDNSWERGDLLAQWKAKNPERYTLLNAQFNDHVTSIMEHMAENNVNADDTVFQADVSGSMTGDPLDVATSASVIGASLTTGPFRNRVMTFESIARWIKLEYPSTRDEYMSFCGYGGNYGSRTSQTKFPIGKAFDKSRVGQELDWLEKLYVINCSGWGGHTNLLSALDLVVSIAEEYNVPLPKRIITITDMEWDAADRSNSMRRFASRCFGTHMRGTLGVYKTLLGQVRNAITTCGMKMPEFIVWNVNGNNSGTPALASDPDIRMVSGFNVSMLKLFFNTGELTAPEGKTQCDSWEMLDTILSHEEYDKVREVCDRVGEVRGQSKPVSYKTAAMMPAPQVVNHDGAAWERDIGTAYGCGEAKTPPSTQVSPPPAPTPGRSVTDGAISSMVDSMSKDDMRAMLQALMNKI